jgi:hypothetical protein
MRYVAYMGKTYIKKLFCIPEGICDLYASPNIVRVIKSRRMRWVGHVACMEAIKNLYQVLVGKSVGKRQLERRRHRWEDNIRIDLKEMGWGGRDCIHLAQDRDQWQAVVNT